MKIKVRELYDTSPILAGIGVFCILPPIVTFLVRFALWDFNLTEGDFIAMRIGIIGTVMLAINFIKIER